MNQAYCGVILRANVLQELASQGCNMAYALDAWIAQCYLLRSDKRKADMQAFHVSRSYPAALTGKLAILLHLCKAQPGSSFLWCLCCGAIFVMSLQPVLCLAREILLGSRCLCKANLHPHIN